MWKGSFKNAENKMIMGNNEKRMRCESSKMHKESNCRHLSPMVYMFKLKIRFKIM